MKEIRMCLYACVCVSVEGGDVEEKYKKEEGGGVQEGMRNRHMEFRNC